MSIAICFNTSLFWTVLSLLLSVKLTIASTTQPANTTAWKPERPTSAKGMHQLIKDIFETYDKELMPSRPVMVKLDVLLLKVKSTVEKEGIFESVVALFIEWHDERMAWTPEEYDNVTVLAVDSEKVWLPDIAMTNSAEHLYSISRDTRFVVRLTNDGNFKFVPTGTAKTWCDLKLVTFPFDIQQCSLTFESWSLDVSTMAFERSATIFVDHNFLSSEWTLCKNNTVIYNHFYEFTGETFSRAQFDFTVRRKSTFYMVNLFFPCATLSAIQVLVFAIPSIDCSSDRIGFATTNLLTLVVFQTIVTNEMPKTSDAVTALSKYIIALIILSATGIFESVIVERMRRISHQPPPKALIRLARLLPLIWRRKPVPDYPNILVASGDAYFVSSQAAGDFISSRRPLPIPLSAPSQVVDTDVDQRPSATTANGGNNVLHEEADEALSRTSSANFSVRQRGRAFQRKYSRFAAVRDYQERRAFVESQYCELWGEVATRLDLLTFLISSILAVAIPLALFIPLLFFGECSPDMEVDVHR